MTRASALALIAALAIPAHAIAGPEDDARREFDAGRAALKTGRFAEARDNFRRALALAPKAPSAFNLGVALRGTGEPVEAVSVFEALLAGSYGELSADQRAQIDALLSETRAEIATLELRVEGAPVAEVRIDGRRVKDLPAGQVHTQALDPGAYVVSASAPQRLPAEQRIELARGGRSAMTLQLVQPRELSEGRLIVEGEPGDLVRVEGVGEGPVPFERMVAPGVYHVVAVGPNGERATDVTLDANQTLRVRMEGDSGSLVSSPWFWGAIVVVAAGAAATAVVLTRGGAADPVSDPTYGVVTALRGR